MFSSKSAAVGAALAATLCSAAAVFAQTTHAAAASMTALEFPVLMRQKIEAGKTPVGTRIQAKLTVATLVNGVVIPRDAILSGEVIESTFKSATGPSRLSIWLDAAEWKNGPARAALSLPSKIYLTAWYYPLPSPSQEFPDAISDATHSGRQRRGSATPYPDSDTRDSLPSASGNTTKNPAPSAPSATVSQHRELMKNIESTHGGSGAVVLTSTHSNVKLDKSTTYVFAAGDLGAGSDSRTQ